VFCRLILDQVRWVYDQEVSEKYLRARSFLRIIMVLGFWSNRAWTLSNQTTPLESILHFMLQLQPDLDADISCSALFLVRCMNWGTVDPNFNTSAYVNLLCRCFVSQDVSSAAQVLVVLENHHLRFFEDKPLLCRSLLHVPVSVPGLPGMNNCFRWGPVRDGYYWLTVVAKGT